MERNYLEVLGKGKTNLTEWIHGMFTECNGMEVKEKMDGVQREIYEKRILCDSFILFLNNMVSNVFFKYKF